MKFGILTEFEFDYKLFRALDTNTTDFAKREGKGYEGWCVEEVDCNGPEACIYTNDGKINYLDRSNPYVGIRPSTSRSVIESYGKTIRDLGNGLKEMECGEYPQEKVIDDFQEQLTQDLFEGKLNQTGRMYTVYNNDEKNPDTIKLIEVTDEDGNKYVNKDNTWYKVSPVIWIVNEKTNLALTKYMIQGGIPYGEYVLPYMSEWEKEYERIHPMKLPPSVRRMHKLREVNPTIIEGFLNVVLSEELIDRTKKVKEVKEEEKENGPKTEKPRRQRRTSGGGRVLYKSPLLQNMDTFDYIDRMQELYEGNPEALSQSGTHLEKLLKSLREDIITLEAALMYKHPEQREQYIEGKRALRKTLLDYKENKKR